MADYDIVNGTVANLSRKPVRADFLPQNVQELDCLRRRFPPQDREDAECFDKLGASLRKMDRPSRNARLAENFKSIEKIVTSLQEIVVKLEVIVVRLIV